MNAQPQFQPKTARDPFGLSALPVPPVPQDGWPAIERSLKRRQRMRRSLVWLASAATVTLAVSLYLHAPESQPGPIVQTAADSVTAQGSPRGTLIGREENLRALVRLSQQLEKNLRLVRAEVGSMPAQSVLYQVELEDLVAQLDEAISQRPDSRELWSQRVNLLLDLNQLYQVQLRRDYRNVASL